MFVELKSHGSSWLIHVLLTSCRKNQQLIQELSKPSPGNGDLYFSTMYNLNIVNQWVACFWKQHWSYWRNSQDNVVRLIATLLVGLLFGTIFWKRGEKFKFGTFTFSLTWWSNSTKLITKTPALCNIYHGSTLWNE